jgi:hypothetical protein
VQTPRFCGQAPRWRASRDRFRVPRLADQLADRRHLGPSGPRPILAAGRTRHFLTRPRSRRVIYYDRRPARPRPKPGETWRARKATASDPDRSRSCDGGRGSRRRRRDRAIDRRTRGSAPDPRGIGGPWSGQRIGSAAFGASAPKNENLRPVWSAAELSEVASARQPLARGKTEAYLVQWPQSSSRPEFGVRGRAQRKSPCQSLCPTVIFIKAAGWALLEVWCLWLKFPRRSEARLTPDLDAI